MNKRTLVHVHEYEVSPKLLSKFLFGVVKRKADQVITVSHFLAKNPSLGSKPSTVVPNAVSLKFESQAKKNSFPSNGEFHVLMLASLRPYKGINEFVQLAKELPKLTFKLVLSDSDTEVNNWKIGQELPSNLLVFPVQENVIPFFQTSSLLLNLAHPDKWVETFGMTVLEGMHFGLPVIVPTQGGVTELVEDGKNGFLVDYTELEKIKNLIFRISSNEDLWNALSEESKERAEAFSFLNFRSKIQSIF